MTIQMTVDTLGSISFWAGALVAVLKLVDWLLSPQQKRTLASWAATAWIWLDEQRLGKFVAAVRSLHAQRILSLVAHAIILLVSLLFLGRAFLGWRGLIEIYIGTPRLYLSQVWVDIAAILVSMILLSFFCHPRITAWIAGASSVSYYFVRAGGAAALSYAILQLYIHGLIWVGLPLGRGTADGTKGFLGPAFFAPGSAEDYGGTLNVVVLHAVTALLGAPVLIETLLLLTILYCSIGWMLFISLLSGLHIAGKFVMLRIAEHKDGPVLAVSALLIAAGAIIKLFIS